MVSLSRLQYFVRYVSTSYGALCQQNFVQLDAEVFYQMMPLLAGAAQQAAAGSAGLKKPCPKVTRFGPASSLRPHPSMACIHVLVASDLPCLARPCKCCC